MSGTDHKSMIAEIRKQIKAKCPTLSVKMGRGTAWGSLDIWSGGGGNFTGSERTALHDMGFTPGGNFCCVMSGAVGYWAKKLAGTLTDQDIERQDRYESNQGWD